MPATYDVIATNTLSTATQTVTFSSLPSTYTDIVAIISGTSDSTLSHRIQFNGDASGTYSTNWYAGTGSATSGNFSGPNETIGIRWNSQQVGTPANYPYVARIYVQHYRQGSRHGVLAHSAFAEPSGAYADTLAVGSWNVQAAITSISFTFASTANYKAGTIFTLYGIKAA